MRVQGLEKQSSTVYTLYIYKQEYKTNKSGIDEFGINNEYKAI